MSDDRKIDLVKQWVAKAESDFISADRLLPYEDPTNDTICFHYQQGAEKYLKAYSVRYSIPFPKTHDLGRLIEICSQNDAAFNTLRDEAELLSNYGVAVRYPDEWYIPSTEETQEACEIAKKIKAFVLSRIDIDRDNA